MEKMYVITVEGGDLCSTNIPRVISRALLDNPEVCADRVNVHVLRDGEISIAVTPPEMLVISSAISGMLAEVECNPSLLERAVSTFRELHEVGAVASISCRIIDICKQELIKELMK